MELEVWGVKSSLGEAAELSHRSFLKCLLGTLKSTSNEIVLAELGCYPLQLRFWQQILKYPQRTFGLDDTRLVSLAVMDRFMFSGGIAGVDKGAEWHEQLNSFSMKHNLSVFTNLTLEVLLTEPSSSTLSNSAVTVHHLALLYTRLYSLSTDLLSTCVRSDGFQI